MNFGFISTIWAFLRETIPVISPILTVILTGLLVWLYKKQSKILERQKELIEAEGRALPRILTYRMFSQRDLIQFQQYADLPESPWDDKNVASFIAYMKNPGKGYATDIRVELRIRSDNFQLSTSDPLARNTNVDQLAYDGTDGGVIAPEENNLLPYVAKLTFQSEGLPEEFINSDIKYEDIISPSEIFWILNDIGESYVDIGIFIHYKDETGSKSPIQLHTSRSDLEEYSDLRNLWRSRRKPPKELEPLYPFDP